MAEPRPDDPPGVAEAGDSPRAPIPVPPTAYEIPLRTTHLVDPIAYFAYVAMGRSLGDDKFSFTEVAFGLTHCERHATTITVGDLKRIPRAADSDVVVVPGREPDALFQHASTILDSAYRAGYSLAVDSPIIYPLSTDDVRVLHQTGKLPIWIFDAGLQALAPIWFMINGIDVPEPPRRRRTLPSTPPAPPADPAKWAGTSTPDPDVVESARKELKALGASVPRDPEMIKRKLEILRKRVVDVSR